VIKESGRGRSRFDNLVATAQGQYTEAQQSQVGDKSRAEDLLASASSNLKEAAGMHFDDSRVKNLQTKVMELSDTLGSVTRVVSNPLVDLSSLRSKVSGVSMVGGGSDLYVLDSGGALFAVDISARKAKLLNSDVRLKQGKLLAQVGNDLLVVVPGSGVYDLDLKSGKFGLALGVDRNWGEIVGEAGFQSYLYLLDKSKNMIWRYLVSDGHLKAQVAWLKSGSDLSLANSLAVDGSVWVGERDSVSKFVQGMPNTFSVSVNPAPNQVRGIYSTTDTRNVYLVDSDRLLVASKSGQLIGQYKSDKLNGITGLVVDEIVGKAYILAGSMVYEFDLKP
jgi:hypothetical protein